jgi:hypothetical protein
MFHGSELVDVEVSEEFCSALHATWDKLIIATSGGDK